MSIVRELEYFSPTLAARPRWLLFNKIDLLDDNAVAERQAAVITALNWKGPFMKFRPLKSWGQIGCVMT